MEALGGGHGGVTMFTYADYEDDMRFILPEMIPCRGRQSQESTRYSSGLTGEALGKYLDKVAPLGQGTIKALSDPDHEPGRKHKQQTQLRIDAMRELRYGHLNGPINLD